MSYSCKCQCESFRRHALSVNVSAVATPTRREEVSAISAREQRWDRDMPAYKRMRQDSLQPPHIDGAADLETRATDELEVRTGRIYGDSLPIVKEVQTALDESKL